MIRRHIVRLTLIQAMVLMAMGCSHPRLTPGVPVHDGFDDARLSSLWETDKITSADMRWQSAVTRAGRGALKISLHAGDKFEAGKNGNLNSERAELTEAEDLYAAEGNEYAYAFSIFIPADFPIVTTRLVLAQWKQECPRGGACNDNSPVLAVRYVGGTLMVTQTIGPSRTVLWKTQADVKNRWLDFSFRVRFSHEGDGLIAGRLNDSLIVDFKGATAYREDAATGYPSPSRFYFKMGLYRDTMSEPMTIYLDEYRKELIAHH